MKTRVTILAENDNPLDKNISIQAYEEAGKAAWQAILDMLASLPGSMDKAEVLKFEVIE